MTLKIEPGKEYRLRNGLRVKVQANTGNGEWKVIGYIYEYDTDREFWTKDGVWQQSGDEHPLDIVGLWDDQEPMAVSSPSQQGVLIHLLKESLLIIDRIGVDLFVTSGVKDCNNPYLVLANNIRSALDSTIDSEHYPDYTKENVDRFGIR